jgi:hypothetical protein
MYYLYRFSIYAPINNTLQFLFLILGHSIYPSGTPYNATPYAVNAVPFKDELQEKLHRMH